MTNATPPSHLNLAPVDLEVTMANDGSSRWRAHASLAQAPHRISDVLSQRAALHPERVFLGERAADGFRTVSYAQAKQQAAQIGAGLLELGASATKPVMIVSENSIDHALITLGAMHVGVPVAPISTAYSLQSADFKRLLSVASTLAPAVVFASSPGRFSRALQVLQKQTHAKLVCSDGEVADALPLTALVAAPTGASARLAAESVGPDTVAKILFTSGSTGEPNGVVNTQRMLTSNQQMIRAVWPFLQDEPPITLDWLPWSHTFGGNHNFMMVLFNGGTLYIDDGRAAPHLVERTARNLLDIQPTIYFNVPRGFELLLPFLESDKAVRRAFFERLRVCFYAAAALPASTWQRLQNLADVEGREVFFTTAWGSTETAPLSTSAHFRSNTAAMIGVPVPGVELKIAPVGDKWEVRVRGPHVTTGVWRPGGQIHAIQLDEDGFLPTGDAVTWAEPGNAARGLVFDGRIGENFKLASGTWVSTGRVRVALVSALNPYVQDAVLTGHDRSELGALLFASSADSATLSTLRHDIESKVRSYNQRHRGSSECIRRALIVFEPPSLDAGETTDKGYINQRRVLQRRADLVDRLYAAVPDADVLVFGAADVEACATSIDVS
jgi:feruloyl-CoA synthase